MHNLTAIKQAVRREIGSFSEREFHQAHVYILHKHRNNPGISEDWYLGILIAETIRQNRFSVYTQARLFARRRVRGCKLLEFAKNAAGS